MGSLPGSGGGSYVLCIPYAIVLRVGCLHIAYQGDRVMRACSHGTMPLWAFALHALKMRCCFLGDMRYIRVYVRVHVVVILRTERHNNSTDNVIRLPFGELEASRIVS